MRCSRSSAGSAQSSSTPSRLPAARTTSCCTRGSPTTSPPGASCCTNAARSSRRTTRASPSSRRASSPGSARTCTSRRRVTLDENAEVAERVLEKIRAEGPLSSLDFERERGAQTDWFGIPTNTVRAVLDAYAITGVLGLARRDGNRRYYDLLERLLPADLLARDLPLKEQLRHKLLSRYRAHGSARHRGRWRHLQRPRLRQANAGPSGTNRAAR